NFAVIPTVTSRYPLWDRKSPELTTSDHTRDDKPRTAKQLGIPMPNPSIKPLFVALWMVLMFSSMLLMHLKEPKPTLAIAGIITFAALMTLTLYSWLLTPLEDAH
ncbi:MAG: cytochrome ubiquinol oxidase subunit I, partial [Gemmatimonadaceae bacterium]